MRNANADVDLVRQPGHTHSGRCPLECRDYILDTRMA